MKEEFAVYGLSESVMKVVGGLKILFALMLLVGIWVPVLVLPAAAGMAVLMTGAVMMHVKVKDAPQKSLPAFTMLVMSVLVIVL
ncbi:DoxX family protein [Sulfuriroseicoccus oceanibius]|uniref:DoxX family protein n=1 Tax=Sulfuriroseicoccus oceanibius TaxID=2707525 RepID=A0A7T7F357_9BACT|nr:DoxX family protein [Sulfuriroseicoccus oceanibius]QQL45916.1 DoxX family protein [Sulfuriroseicoccus oceanibius]